jgi:hypothetical protein
MQFPFPSLAYSFPAGVQAWYEILPTQSANAERDSKDSWAAQTLEGIVSFMAVTNRRARSWSDYAWTKAGLSSIRVCRSAVHTRRLDPDGGNPGPDLTLLMAVLLYHELFGESPSDAPLSVHASIYGPMNSPWADSFASTQSVAPEVVRTVSYDVATVSEVIGISQALCKFGPGEPSAAELTHFSSCAISAITTV